MRNGPASTSIAATIALWGCLATAGTADRGAPSCATQPTTQPADHALDQARAWIAKNDLTRADTLMTDTVAQWPQRPDVWQTWVDVALAQHRYSVAAERARRALTRHDDPQTHYRLALALYGLDRILGDADVRTVRRGQVGHFVNNRLLLLERDGAQQFLCCGPDAAFYHLRRALDGGVDAPRAHILHARFWQHIGKPEVGLSILEHQLPVLLATPERDDVHVALADLKLAIGDVDDYLTIQRQRAAAQPKRRAAILAAACGAVAEHYGIRGQARLHVHWLARAVRETPNDADLLLRLADAEWTAGQRRAAARHYQALLRAHPQHGERRRILLRLAELTSEDAANR